MNGYKTKGYRTNGAKKKKIWTWFCTVDYNINMYEENFDTISTPLIFVGFETGYEIEEKNSGLQRL